MEWQDIWITLLDLKNFTNGYKFTKGFNGLAGKFLQKIKRPTRNVNPNLPGYLDT